MNISGIQSGQGPMRGQELSPEERLNNLVEKIESGDIDTDKLQEKLTHRFGEDADGIVSEDGSVDIESMKELFASQAPQGGPSPQGQGQGGMMPPPPPPPEEGDLQSKLTEMFGEETTAGFFNEDGDLDFDALMAALQENMPEEQTGSLLSVQA
ncbi:hypothetical protein [Oceanospirillum sediminis]|uniref:Uncharacterized protein n=1 Tax=Oceanospirillum sediminis TaxID=2760088 RepID=A0A839IMY0_9GAMM|nr:hypothetical protein [Oceanospirillum sediminis]MBB1486054.1 hypothetical protein [Oceanospirillum sediminis]